MTTLSALHVLLSTKAPTAVVNDDCPRACSCAYSLLLVPVFEQEAFARPAVSTAPKAQRQMDIVEVTEVGGVGKEKG